MYPYALPKTATVFTGGTILPDALSCKVTETLEGESELVLEYPYNGENADAIGFKTFLVAAASPGRGLQPFRVYRMRKELDGILTVNARHLSYDLSTTVCRGLGIGTYTTAAAAIAEVKNRAIDLDSHFTFSTDITTTGLWFHPETFPATVRQYLVGGRESVQAIYGGEWEWNGYACTLHTKRGTVRSVGIRYGLNMTSMRLDVNYSEVYDRLLPFFKKDSLWLEGNMVTIPNAISPAGVYTYDTTSFFDAEPSSTADITAYGTAYVQAHGTELASPVPEISLSYVPLEQTDDPAAAVAASFEMGDTVPVSVPWLGVDMSARVVKTEYDALRERYAKINIGKAEYNAADTMSKLYLKTKVLEDRVFNG